MKRTTRPLGENPASGPGPAELAEARTTPAGALGSPRDDSAGTDPADQPRADGDSLSIRLQRALGPLLGGIMLDAVDLITFGPVGLYSGAILGGAVGWWVGSLYDFSPRGRILLSIAAAVYATLPFTEVLPLATLIGAIIRVWGDQSVSPKT